MIIATDPARFRPMMLAAIVEKLSYATVLVVLFTQNRLHASDLTFGVVDLLFAVLFVIAFVRTRVSV